MGTESLEDRFAVVAFEKGLVTAEQIMEALDIQVREDLARKGHRLIGTILRSLGYMTESQVKEVLQDMFKNRLL